MTTSRSAGTIGGIADRRIGSVVGTLGKILAVKRTIQLRDERRCSVMSKSFSKVVATVFLLAVCAAYVAAYAIDEKQVDPQKIY